MVRAARKAARFICAISAAPAASRPVSAAAASVARSHPPQPAAAHARPVVAAAARAPLAAVVARARPAEVAAVAVATVHAPRAAEEHARLAAEVEAAEAWWWRRMDNLWLRRRAAGAGRSSTGTPRRIHDAPLLTFFQRLALNRRRGGDYRRLAARLLDHRRPGARRHARWPVLLLLLLLLLTSGALHRAQRMATELPVFTLAERLRRARRGGRLDRRGGGLHGNRRNTPDRAFGAQVIPVHGQRALHTRRGAEHARAHIVGVQRHVRAAGDESGREARIDPEPPAFHVHRAVDQAGFAQDDHAAVPRHEVGAHARLGDIAQRHEHPVVRLLVVSVHQVVRRQRRPADIVAAIAPIDPGRRPFVARHPEPAEAAVHGPAAVVIDHPAPIVLARFGDPVPAPVVGKDPAAVFIGPPIRRHPVRHPDLAVTWVADPMAVGIERCRHVFGRLRDGRRERSGHNRHRNAGDTKRKAGRRAEQEAADDGSVDHFLVPRSNSNDRMQRPVHRIVPEHITGRLNGSRIVWTECRRN